MSFPENPAQRPPDKSTNETQLIEYLNNLDGIQVIDQPSIHAVPTLDLSELTSPRPKQDERITNSANDLAARCIAYISGPLITDRFGADHSKRREWRRYIAADPKYGERFITLWRRNKLRLNNFASLHSSANIMESVLRVGRADSPRALAVRALMLQFPDYSHYEQMTDVEKIEFVRAVEDFCRKYLQLMTADSNTETTNEMR